MRSSIVPVGAGAAEGRAWSSSSEGWSWCGLSAVAAAGIVVTEADGESPTMLGSCAVSNAAGSSGLAEAGVEGGWVASAAGNSRGVTGYDRSVVGVDRVQEERRDSDRRGVTKFTPLNGR